MWTRNVMRSCAAIAAATLPGALVIGAALGDVASAPVLVVQAASQALASQTNTGGGVTVKVTPRRLASGTGPWEFEVVFDTHSVELSHDLAKIAVLIDAQGTQHRGSGWVGDPPGGHHREGVLSFQPLPPGTESVILEISQVGGVAKRIFRWQLR